MILALAASAALASPPLLHLEDAVHAARLAQPSLAEARARSAAAGARADLSFGALLPQLSVSVGYQRGTANPGEASPATSFDYFSVSSRLNQLIYDFGHTWGTWRAAQTSQEVGTLELTTRELDVVYDVRVAFFAARAAQDLLRVAEETVANHERHLAQVQGYVEAGVRPQIDVVQARADRANAEVARINAANARATTRARLAQAMGEAAGDFVIADDTLLPVEGEDTPLAILLAEALASRPELKATAAQGRAQEETAAALWGGYWPSLSAAAVFSDTGRRLPAMSWNWSAGATLSWPLFSGGQTRAAVAEAEASAQAFAALAKSTELQVRFEVEEAQLAVHAARAAVRAAEEALTNARVRLELAEGRYQTGVGTILELGDAQLALTATAAQRVQADYNLASARAQLLRALGRP